ncbi:hypothetical protein PG996_007913 [Apiospora saccharicola]|uniref:Heterokaryon incompatibility domain-containing protein n=1 Tax=Apiospora saccharicola TaxID=335842 RepID=A0ABR1UYX9_9PEZI
MSRTNESFCRKSDQTGSLRIWAKFLEITGKSIAGDKSAHPDEPFRTDSHEDLAYEPLPQSSCIRLLSIQSTKPGQVINCSLRTVDLSQRPKYQALSYTWEKDPHLASRVFSATARRWDIVAIRLHSLSNAVNRALLAAKAWTKWGENLFADPGSRRKIVCDGQTTHVTANLYDALHQLRQTCPGEDFWIDALCINQRNPGEVDSQVGMMDRIYRQASRVIVWLGTCPTFLNQELRKLSNFNVTDTGHDSASQDYDITDSEVASWALVYILHRRWFSRVWVVQEFCSAQESVVLMGDHQISTVRLLISIQQLKRLLITATAMPHSASTRPDPMVFLNYYGSLARKIQMSEMMKLWGHQFSLEEWTDLSANRMASKGCDMLYGGLSMIEQSSLVIDQTLKLEEPKRLPRATPTVNHDDIAPRPRPPRPICSGPNIQQFLMPTELRNNTPLWPALRVDSEASMSTVLLNWAACLLSRPNQLVLLSFASRLRVPYLGLSDNKWLLGEFDPGQEDVFPSWYPLPWFVTSRLTNRFVKAEAMGGVDDGDHYDFRAPLSRQQRAV